MEPIIIRPPHKHTARTTYIVAVHRAIKRSIGAGVNYVVSRKVRKAKPDVEGGRLRYK